MTARYVGHFTKSELGERAHLIIEDGAPIEEQRYRTASWLDDDTRAVRAAGDLDVDVDFFDNCPYVKNSILVQALI